MRAVVIYEPGCPGTQRIAEAIADGLPAYPVPVIATADATARDIEHTDLVVLGGLERRLGLSGPMRTFLSRVANHTWYGRHVAAFGTADPAQAHRTSTSTGEMTWRLRIRHVASPLPQERFNLAADLQTPCDGEETRARTWAKSLPIAAHM